MTRGALALRYGIARRAMAGEAVCGDVAVVAERATGFLLAAIDGVGHGEQALSAARTAADILESNPSDPIVALVERCHAALRGTRGVAMCVAAIHSARRRLTWLGVGNVQGLVLHATTGPGLPHEVLLQRAGLVGGQLPRLYASSVPLLDGDFVALASDGVRTDFASGLVGSGTPQRVAECTLAALGQPSDDALVIVAQVSEQSL
jgi:negative regulator of sigma-B (phosphoserine phosphatase)